MEPAFRGPPYNCGPPCKEECTLGYHLDVDGCPDNCACLTEDDVTVIEAKAKRQKKNMKKAEAKAKKEGRLVPSEVDAMTIFTDWKNSTHQLGLEGEPPEVVADGSITWPPPLNRVTSFAVIPQLLSSEQVTGALELLNPSNTSVRPVFDIKPDSVDAMPTHEFYLHEGPGQYAGGDEDRSDENQAYRRPIRDKLMAILQPAEDKMTRFVREHFPELCAKKGKDHVCMPCYSLIRRYMPDERQTHMMHRDGQALVTVVVSLSTYGKDFKGGLYVAVNGAQRQVIPLSRGDAIFHSYDLLHGVQVEGLTEGQTGERWSWISWYKDSPKCEQRGYEWSRECADAGDALCQYTYGWRVHLHPTLSQEMKDSLRNEWMQKSANGGFAQGMFTVGRSELGKQNYSGAVKLFKSAIAGGEADASYQMAQLLLLGLLEPSDAALEYAADVVGSTTPSLGIARSNQKGGPLRQIAVEREALEMIEVAAAAGASNYGGATKAMYNLGVIWLYGYGGVARDPTLAAAWFKMSAIPEGLMALSLFYEEQGRAVEAAKVEVRARKEGFGTLERKNGRDQGLFNLHLNWPEGPPLW